MSGIIAMVIIWVLMYKVHNNTNGINLCDSTALSNAGEYHGFNWDAYNFDVRNGMNAYEQMEKNKRGGYWL